MKLIGDIERYDEVLTMSARMYAATGDPRWLGRYEEHERLLDSALARGRRLAPPIVGGIVAETAEANEALVAMERRSMALANSGRRNESLAILDSGAYDAHKRSYALGMRQAARNIEDRTRTRQQEFAKSARRTVAILGSALAGLALSAGVLGWRLRLHMDRQRQEREDLSRSNAKLEQDLSDRDNLLAEVFQTTTVGLLILEGESGVIRQINPAAAFILGREESDCLGRPLAEITGHPLTSPCESYGQLGACRVLQPSGTYRYVLSSVRTVPLDGRDQTLLTMLDITERRLAEEALMLRSEELAAANARLESVAMRDALTGLANRGYFATLLDERIQAAARDGTGLTLLFLDLDNFKFVNDSLGHDAGDRLLMQVAERMRGAVAASDIVARLGGDEFAVVIVENEASDTAVAVAARLVEAMEVPFGLGGSALTATVSVGVARLGAGDTAADLTRKADTAMYFAKRAGKSQFCLYSAEMGEAVDKRLRLEAELREAWSERQFAVAYQPIVDPNSGTTVSVEALLRWPMPSGVPVPPSVFIPLAEEIGLIEPIGYWVMEEACRAACRWQAGGGAVSKLAVAVNVSVHQVRRADFVQKVLGVVEQTGIDPSRLTLEITETLVMSDLARNSEKFNELRRHGVRIAIDDFGTGYSSMGSLATLPADIVKLDKSFVDPIGRIVESTAILRTLITLCRVMGMKVVAEGVETEEQATQLLVLGCDYLQGYFGSEALSESDLVAFVEQSPRLLAA